MSKKHIWSFIEILTTGTKDRTVSVMNEDHREVATISINAPYSLGDLVVAIEEACKQGRISHAPLDPKPIG